MGRRASRTPNVGEHRGRMRARWTVAGVRHEVDLGPADQPEVWRAEYARLCTRLASDPLAPPRSGDDTLVAGLVRAFLLSSAVLPTMRAELRRKLRPFATAFAEMPAADVSPRRFGEWRDALCRQTRADGRPLYTRGHVVRMMATAVRCYRWGVETERLPAAAWHALQAVAPPARGQGRESRVVPAADPAHVEATLPYLSAPAAGMVRLQRLTGMRPSELFRLTPGQVHRSGVVAVPGAGAVDLDALGVWLYLPDTHKTERHGRAKWVVLNNAAQAVLAPFLLRPPGQRCFDPRDVPGPGRRSERYTKETYGQAVERAARKAGVPHWTPYQLRHLYGEQVDARLGLDAVQHVLGHSSAQTTRRYAKVSLRQSIDAAKAMGG